jgi:hypothetical protein
MSDRTVHAVLTDGRQIVRYDRSGKWYWENERHRNHLTLGEAVALAKADKWATVIVGLSGGSAFDRAFKK